MNVQRSQRDHFNLSKRIPLHYQKRYFANISNGSFNATFLTGVYKNKIKSVLNNNKVLALALQNDRAKIKELLEENKANANIIMFSRLKLASLSDNIKKVVTVLDETLALFQMHSSVSSTKFTPKNTLGRDEFKVQVKDVSMDSIPEEAESPQRKTEDARIEVACLNHKQSSPAEEATPLAYQINVKDKNLHSSEEPKKSLKSKKYYNANKKSSIVDADKNFINPINSKENYQPDSVYIYKELSPRKTVATKPKKRSKNTMLMPKTHNKKCVNKSISNKKGGKINKGNIGDEEEIVSCSIKNNIKKKENIPLEKKNYNSKLKDDILILDDLQMIEDKNVDLTSFLENGVSPGNFINDTDVILSVEKENKSSNKRQKLSAKSFGTIQSEPSVTKITYARSSALKSLSSKINIENSMDKVEVDDLVKIKTKIAEIMSTKKSPDIRDTSRSYLQELSLCQQEFVENIAKNAILVPAGFRNSPEPIKTDKLSQSCSTISKKPVVLIKDIKYDNSFSKSVSHPACDEFNATPLNLKLLGHCSSLMVIPEESIDLKDNSTGKYSDSKTKSVETSMTVKSELSEQPVSEERRTFRKRSVSINYKEPSTNTKLRR